MSIISISEVSKSFGKKIALDRVDLEINQGEIFGFLGPNGAGKSTTIRCIMGFIYPDNGIIKVDDLLVDRTHSLYRESIGYVPSDLQLNPNWTGDEHISFVREARNVSTSIDKEIKKLSFDATEKVKYLSTGNKQKLAFLLALMVKPKILILDEPTKGLDPLLQEVFYEMLIEFKNSGGCVFFSSHNLPEVEHLCDRIGIIRAGKIVANETMESLRQKNVLIAKIIFNAGEKIPDFSSASQVISVSDRSVHLRVEGDINPLIREISKYNVVDVSIEHANLEEVFMHFYEDNNV